MTIDTHIHFYDPKRPQGVPWPSPDNSLLYRTVLPADYEVIAKQIGVDAVVVVEASPWIDDNQWILDIAESCDLVVGFVGNLDMYDKEFSRHVDRFTKNPYFKGIRKGRVVEEDLKRDDFLDNVSLLAEKNLSLDLLAQPQDLKAVAALMQKVDDLTLVLDHVTHVPVIPSGPTEDWVRDLNTIGSFPNGYCKISGLTESACIAGNDAPEMLLNPDLYKPFLEALYGAFGPKRLLFATNWPVVDLATSAKQMVDVVLPYFEEKGEEVVSDVWGNNAVRAYNLVID